MADEKAAEKPKEAAKPKKAAGKVRPSIKKGSFYDGKGAKKANFCPKCGPGIFMAKHKDRQTCGKCGYTEFNKKE